ncbi:MAG TPA: zinc ribbon domain-containing protein [Solirubrobacteraceae bacterium]|jgi:predicted nucleic acid-binding Zn ribbon protein|nr:zinc ribbon domain-containing protein [Solirubrobacteraceae bacterium]
MPIYEYRRPDGTTFELQQSFSDDPLEVDPDTGVPVERVLHPPAVHFKGKGFYSTDYGSRRRERETVAAAEGGGDGASSSSDKSSDKKKDAGKDGTSKSADGAGGASKKASSTVSSGS